MTNQEKIDKINEWQNAGFVHELTCGNDSNHGLLVAEEIDGKVFLTCTDCDFIQEHIPKIVFEADLEASAKVLKEKGFNF